MHWTPYFLPIRRRTALFWMGKYRNRYRFRSSTRRVGVSFRIHSFTCTKLFLAYIFWWKYIFSVVSYSPESCQFLHTNMISWKWSEGQNLRNSSNSSRKWLIILPRIYCSSRPSYNLRCKSFLRFIGFLVSSLFWIIIMNSKLDRSCRERKLLQNPPISHIAKQWENTDRKWTDFSEMKHFFKNRISTRDSHVLNATETPDYRSIKHL